MPCPCPGMSIRGRLRLTFRAYSRASAIRTSSSSVISAPLAHHGTKRVVSVLTVEGPRRSCHHHRGNGRAATAAAAGLANELSRLLPAILGTRNLRALLLLLLKCGNAPEAWAVWLQGAKTVTPQVNWSGGTLDAVAAPAQQASRHGQACA